MKIAVAGTGYVGLSIATLLAQNNEVTAVDVIPEKVEMINNRKSPIQDDYIEKYLGDPTLIPFVGTPSLNREGRGGSLYATLDGKAAYQNADFVVIAVPTNYDPVKNFFDTHLIEDVIDLVLSVNPDAVMVIKSTIPVPRSYEKRNSTCSSLRNSCARARHFTTTSTRVASSWAILRSSTIRSSPKRMPPSMPSAIPKPRNMPTSSPPSS